MCRHRVLNWVKCSNYAVGPQNREVNSRASREIQKKYHHDLGSLFTDDPSPEWYFLWFLLAKTSKFFASSSWFGRKLHDFEVLLAIYCILFNSFCVLRKRLASFWVFLRGLTWQIFGVFLGGSEAILVVAGPNQQILVWLRCLSMDFLLNTFSADVYLYGDSQILEKNKEKKNKAHTQHKERNWRPIE